MEKIKFFKRIKISIVDFDKYFIVATQSIGRSILYIK